MINLWRDLPPGRTPPEEVTAVVEIPYSAANHNFVDGDFLAGFRNPVLERENFSLQYSDVMGLLRELRLALLDLARRTLEVDPEAARIVFQSGIPITMVGLDVTRKTALTDAHIRALEAGQNASSQAAAKIARSVVRHYRDEGLVADPNMHDSLAVAAFLNPSLLKWEDYYVDVETTGELTAGETLGYRPQASFTKQHSGTEKQAPVTEAGERIAVDELTYALMGEEQTGGALSLRSVQIREKNPLYFVAVSGDKPNIVPDYAESFWYVRSEDLRSLEPLKRGRLRKPRSAWAARR